MNFLKNIFRREDESIKTYADFWAWFTQHEKDFFKIVKSGSRIEKDFFRKIGPRLAKLNDGFSYLAGMLDDGTAELVLTPDGVIKNIIFVEELVNAAPAIRGWKITALKPAIGKDAGIKMDKYVFDTDTLSFYPNDNAEFPDEIDLTVVHKGYTETNSSQIITGACIFLDNYLGELNFITTVDNLRVTGNGEAVKQLIPIEKLSDYLEWRRKEFLEKYNRERYNTEKDNYALLEGRLENGEPLIAVVNTALLDWNSKPSHPWILEFRIKYNGRRNNGMPDDMTHELMYDLDDDLVKQLKDFDGYLNIGRQTAGNSREIYFACRDFRNSSKIAYETIKRYKGKLDVTYEIYKDKYWRSFERFRPN